MENIGAKLDTSKPAAELRKEFEESRGLISLPMPSGVKTTDHLVKSNGAEIRVREYSPESIGKHLSCSSLFSRWRMGHW